MAVAIDKVTTTGNFSTNGANTFSVVPVGTPTGILVLIYATAANSDDVTGVTYGGVSLDELSVSPAGAGVTNIEGCAHAFFKASGILSGTQNCVITLSAARVHRAVIYTLTGTQLAVLDKQSLVNTGVANPSITLTIPITAFPFAVAATGNAAIPAVGASCTMDDAIDAGAQGGGIEHKTAATASNFAIAYVATSDDVAMIAVAIAEAVNVSVNASGSEVAVEKGTVTESGGAGISATGSEVAVEKGSTTESGGASVNAGYQRAAVATSAFAGTESPLSESSVWGQASTIPQCDKSVGVLVPHGTGRNVSRRNTPSLGADQYAQAALAGVTDRTNLAIYYVATRVQANGSGYYLGLYEDPDASDNYFVLYNVVCDGSSDFATATQIGSSLHVTLAPIANKRFLVATDTIGLMSIGTTHYILLNGIILGSRTDSTYASGQVAVGFYASTATEVSQASMDSFETGSAGLGSEIAVEQGTVTVSILAGGTDVTVNASGSEIAVEKGSVAVSGDANVSPTGNEVLVDRGTPSVTADANVSASGSEIATESSAAAVTAGASVSASGQEIAAEKGTVSVTGDANVSASGSEVLTEKGSPTVAADASVSASGSEITTEKGSVSVAADANVSATGNQVASEQGAASVSADANVSASGREVSTEQGSTSESGDGNVSAQGSEVLVEKGAVSLQVQNGSGDATVSANGNEVLVEQGSVSISISVNVLAIGAEIAVEIGSSQQNGAAVIAAIGSEVGVELGTVGVSGDANVAVQGNQATVEVGGVQVAIGVDVQVSGIAIDAETGEVTLTGDALITITGRDLNSESGTALVLIQSPFRYTASVSDSAVTRLVISDEAPTDLTLSDVAILPGI